jgi:hypothetical protein
MNDKKNQSKWPDADKRRSAAYAICNSAMKSEDRRRYVISLEDVQFQDGTDTSWIHLLPFAETEHPVYGDIKLDADKMDAFVKNYEGNVVGTDLMVNYEHREGPEGGRAAAWFSGLERRDDGLWGNVSWTPRAAQAVRDGEYKYMSSEYADKFTRETKGAKQVSNVFLGAALTNRPYFKDLAPVNFQDFDAFDPPNGQYSPEDMNLRDAMTSTIRCLNCAYFQPGTSSDDTDGDGDGGSCLVVSGTIDPDQICDCFRPMYADNVDYQELSEEVKMEEFLKKLAVALGMPEDTEEQKVFDEVVRRVTTPPKEDEAALAFAEAYPEEAARIRALEERNRELEVKDLVGLWTKDAKFGVPPTLIDGLKGLRKQLSGDVAIAFDDFMTKLTGTGLVRLGTVGGGDPTRMGDASDQFLGLVKKYQDDHEKVSYADAVRAVASEHRDLARAYAGNRAELTSGRSDTGVGDFIDSVEA